jgi:predicted ribosomally synthesized peptide with nif11-like leader
MSIENAKLFVDAVRKDQALQQRLATAGQTAEVARLAVEAGSERGFSFTAEEFLASIAPGPGGVELSDGQIQGVAGGMMVGGGGAISRGLAAASTRLTVEQVLRAIGAI